jgi:hypothetical protein
MDIMCRKCRATFPTMDAMAEHDCVTHLSNRVSSLENKVDFLMNKESNTELKECTDGSNCHDWEWEELDDTIC